MPEYLRVADELGNEYSVVDTAFDKKHMTVLDEPAADVNGDPLPDKPAKPKSGKAASTSTTTAGKETS